SSARCPPCGLVIGTRFGHTVAQWSAGGQRPRGLNAGGRSSVIRPTVALAHLAGAISDSQQTNHRSTRKSCTGHKTLATMGQRSDRKQINRVAVVLTK